MCAQLQFVRRQKPWRGLDPAHLIYAAGPQSLPNKTIATNVSHKI